MIYFECYHHCICLDSYRVKGGVAFESGSCPNRWLATVFSPNIQTCLSVINPRARMRSKGSRSVCRSVGLSARFLSNRGCCRYQTWICGYVQRALGTTRVWNVIVKEQRVHRGRLKFTLMCRFLVKAESGGYQTWICG